MSQDIAGVLLRHRDRIGEIVDVLARYGFAGLASRFGEAHQPTATTTAPSANARAGRCA